MSLRTPQPRPLTRDRDIFPEPMPFLSSDLAWILDSEQQMDLLQVDLQRTQPTQMPRVRKSRARMTREARRGE